MTKYGHRKSENISRSLDRVKVLWILKRPLIDNHKWRPNLFRQLSDEYLHRKMVQQRMIRFSFVLLKKNIRRTINVLQTTMFFKYTERTIYSTGTTQITIDLYMVGGGNMIRNHGIRIWRIRQKCLWVNFRKSKMLKARTTCVYIYSCENRRNLFVTEETTGCKFPFYRERYVVLRLRSESKISRFHRYGSQRVAPGISRCCYLQRQHSFTITTKIQRRIIYPQRRTVSAPFHVKLYA